MRPSLLAVAIFSAVVVPACATPNRSTRDSGHGSDAGMRDTGMTAMTDTGMTTMHDTGMVVTPDMGMVVMPDGGRDGGGIVRPDAFVAPDTGTDSNVVAPDTGCANDTACSDGLACNGMERCVAGACMPPLAPMSCDDGLSCTTDSCSEPGLCNHVSTCGAGSMCTATGCTTGCSESPCRLLSPQCGCASGQACYPQGATRVCATVGTGASGSTCTNNSSCAAGNVCLNVAASGTAQNLCTRMCANDGECGGGLCVYQLDDGTGTAVPGLLLCSHPCNAVTGAGCPSGTACDIFNETMGAMRYFTDCTAPTTGVGEDGSCSATSPCTPGRACIDTNDGLGNACHHWCNATTGTGCSGGRTCLGFTTPLTINGVTYGVCSF